MLTEVARSIMAASLPICHAPKPSPRSQLRSIFILSCPLAVGRVFDGGSVSVVYRRTCRRWTLPCPGVNSVDRGASDVSILQRFDVEFKIFDVAKTVGQGAQQ